MREKKNRCESRRDFLRRSCLAAAGAGVAGLSAFQAACSKPKSGAVALVVSRSDTAVFGSNGVDSGRAKRLVRDAVKAVAGVKDHKEAFRALFTPSDVVAIKVNCLAGPGLSSSVSVVDALVEGLRSIGVENRRIIVFERTSEELRKAGFEVNLSSDGRPLCFGNDDGGFEEKIEFSGEVGSLWSNVLARRATALINVPVLKDHDLSGVGCAMKNMYGAIHNPNRYHQNNCDPYVADVSAHRYVKEKLRLVVCDALTAQYNGGPARVAAHQWKPGSIIASADPVALDRFAWKLIDEQRKIHGIASLEESKRPPKWLKTASARGLGESSLDKIRIDEA